MTEYEWTCAGCGAVSPNKARSCACATNVVCWGPAGERKNEWKRGEGDAASLTERLIQAAIDYERGSYNPRELRRELSEARDAIERRLQTLNPGA